MNLKDDETTIYVTVRLRIPSFIDRATVNEYFDGDLLWTVKKYDEDDNIFECADSWEIMEAVWAKPE